MWRAFTSPVFNRQAQGRREQKMREIQVLGVGLMFLEYWVAGQLWINALVDRLTLPVALSLILIPVRDIIIWLDLFCLDKAGLWAPHLAILVHQDLMKSWESQKKARRKEVLHKVTQNSILHAFAVPTIRYPRTDRLRTGCHDDFQNSQMKNEEQGLMAFLRRMKSFILVCSLSHGVEKDEIKLRWSGMHWAEMCWKMKRFSSPSKGYLWEPPKRRKMGGIVHTFIMSSTS